MIFKIAACSKKSARIFKVLLVQKCAKIFKIATRSKKVLRYLKLLLIPRKKC